jgi:hypothetical protein
MRTIGIPELALVGFFLLIPLASLIVLYLTRRLQTQERLRAIEKGVPLPSRPRHALLGDPWERAARTRRIGIVLVAAGLGILVFCAAGLMFPDQRERAIGQIAFTAIPIFIGVGLLYESSLRVRDLTARQVPRASADPPREP